MRCYQTNEGRLIPTGKAFSHNSISYPSNWLNVASAEDIAAAGLTVYTPPPIEVVRAPLDREKADGIVRAKDTANKMLAGSDWQVTASVERGRVVPTDWAEYRAAVIAEADRLESQYSTAESYEAIDAIQQNWPENPDEVAAREADEARAAAAKAKREEKGDA